MPRPYRIFVEGEIYHIYNRLGLGERFVEQELVRRKGAENRLASATCSYGERAADRVHHLVIQVADIPFES